MLGDPHFLTNGFICVYVTVWLGTLGGTHVCTSACDCECMCMWKPGKDIGCLPLSFSLHFFCFVLCILRQCLFTEPEVHVSIRLSVKQPLGSTFVYTPVLGLQTPMAAPDFDMGCGDQNAVSTRLCSKCFTH